MIFSNRDILSELLGAVQGIISEKTDEEYAQIAVSTLMQKLQVKFPFLNNISFQSSVWNIDVDVEQISKKEVCKAVEAIIRIVYMDLKNEAGLFFLSEIEVRTKPGFIHEIRENGTDIDLLKIEHHVLFRNLNRLKLEFDNKNQNQQKQSQDIAVGKEEYLMNLEEIEKELLMLLQTQNMAQEGVLTKLNISLDEMNMMLSRLIHFQLLRYVTNDEIELTEKGFNYVKDLNSNHTTLEQ
jgi:hypothetical protein